MKVTGSYIPQEEMDLLQSVIGKTHASPESGNPKYEIGFRGITEGKAFVHLFIGTDQFSVEISKLYSEGWKVE